MFNFLKRKRHQKNNYGLKSDESLFFMAIGVCLAFTKNEEYAKRSANFMVEIAMAETKGGKYWDKTKYAGMGITQIDKIGFTDTIKRTPAARKDLVLEKFGVDLNMVEWVELRHNPRLCFLITRLFLLLRPGAIPDNKQDRAAYWKKWYNSSAGKGTVAHYIEANDTQHA